MNKIFNIKEHGNDNLQKEYDLSMDKLRKFYKINWVDNQPNIFIVDDRQTIDSLKKLKTEDYVIAWARDKNIYLLNKDFLEEESCHKKCTEEEYFMLVCHELSHLFFDIKAGGHNPIWLNEGFAIYISGQNKFKKKPEKFSNFLEFFDKGGKSVYQESGFVVDLLIKKFGEEKILTLLESLKDIRSEDKFFELFKEIYKFELNYSNINNL